MKRYLIYGLYDRITSKLFYVGLTTRPLEIRLKAHLSSAKRGETQLVYKAIRHLRYNIKIGLLKETDNKSDMQAFELKSIAKNNNIVNMKSKIFGNKKVVLRDDYGNEVR